MNDRIYGIDLGTTNSALAYDGVVISDLVPSIVNMDDKEDKEVGTDLLHNFSNTIISSFKADMTSRPEGKPSILASAEVLKELRRQAKNKGYDVDKVVISVPAYFTTGQREATVTAAKIARLEVVELINEPTAAAIKLAQEKKDLFLVYDLGGGTFDVSIIDRRFGSYEVQATDGIKLGGDNFDKIIMRHIMGKYDIKPYHLSREELKELQYTCRKLKESVQAGKRLDNYPYEITTQEYVELMKEAFGKTISLTKEVIAKSTIEDEPFSIVFVGGSTHCPYLKQWISESIQRPILEAEYSPDLIVAEGASYYAKLIEEGLAEVSVYDVTKRLSIGLADGTTKTIIEQDSKIPVKGSIIVTNPVRDNKLNITLYQGKELLAIDDNSIGILEYDMGQVREAYSVTCTVNVLIDRNGIVTLSAKEPLGKLQEVILKV